MRPAEEIERLLTGLRDQTSTAFDERTLSEMFSALETSISGTPARSWRDIGRAIMQSRITKFAAAAVLALAVLLLARHLTGREGPATPGDRSGTVVRQSDNQQAPAPVVTTQEQKLAQLARELDSARGAVRCGGREGPASASRNRAGSDQDCCGQLPGPAGGGIGDAGPPEAGGPVAGPR